MSRFTFQMTPPAGPPEYLPPGFGFTAHEHVSDIAAARMFDSAADAMRFGRGYVSPPHFWESERRHAMAQEHRFRGWSFAAVQVPD